MASPSDLIVNQRNSEVVYRPSHFVNAFNMHEKYCFIAYVTFTYEKH